MRVEQEPKYDVNKVTGRLVNRASGKEIPDDEPVFILRARDCWAALAIYNYAKTVQDERHREIVMARHNDFMKFRLDYPDRVKEPDSP